jgi:hypothetical protein
MGFYLLKTRFIRQNKIQNIRMFEMAHPWVSAAVSAECLLALGLAIILNQRRGTIVG